MENGECERQQNSARKMRLLPDEVRLERKRKKAGGISLRQIVENSLDLYKSVMVYSSTIILYYRY